MTTAANNLFLSVWLNNSDDDAVGASNEQQSSTEGKGKKTSTKKPKKIAKKKRSADGRPRRPLSAYNIFFQVERKRIMEEQKELSITSTKNKRNPKRLGQHANVGFGNLARMVSERWRSVSPDAKRTLDDQARIEKEQYVREMEAWKMNKMSEKQGVDKTVSNQVDIARLVSNHQEDKMPSKDYALSAYSVPPDASPRIPIQMRERDTRAPFPTLPLFEASNQDASFYCAPCSRNQECEPTRRNSDFCDIPSTTMYPNNNNMIPSYSEYGQVGYPSNNHYARSNDYVEEFMGRIEGLVGGRYNNQRFDNMMLAERSLSSSCYDNEFNMDEIDDVMRGLRSNRNYFHGAMNDLSSD